MLNNRNGKLMINILNVLSVGAPLVATFVSNSGSAKESQKIEKLNTASLKSMESTWLQIPVACKARHVHASPSDMTENQLAADVKSIYDAYQA